MIKLIKELPRFPLSTVEAIKIYLTFKDYDDIALFWLQDGKTLISMLDGNMVIDYKNTDKDELLSFVNMIKPKSVFGNFGDLRDIFPFPFEKAGVLVREKNAFSDLRGDTLQSKEIYSLLNREGLSLPPYESFAVDFCRRLNRGNLDYFAIKDLCATVVLKADDVLLLNGIVSLKKGMGSACLEAVLSKHKFRKTFAAAKEELYPFYLKNGFELLYEAAYWRI